MNEKCLRPTAAQIENLPNNIFILNWAALMVVLMIAYLKLIKYTKEQELRKAKSYLVTALILIGMYLFRFQIGNFLIELFQ